MTENELLIKAREARKRSYSPYSKFPVGASVEMTSGKVYTGVNIENSSYGLTICAERVAIFNAISHGESTIRRLALSCENSNKHSMMPCGACRQVISEFSNQDTAIIVGGVGTFSINEILPEPFKINPK